MWRWSKFKMKRHSFITLKHLPFDWCMRAWKGLRMRERARNWRQKNSVQFSRDGVICGEWMAHELVEGLFSGAFGNRKNIFPFFSSNWVLHSIHLTSFAWSHFTRLLFCYIYRVSIESPFIYSDTFHKQYVASCNLQHSKTIQQLKLTNGNPWITWFFRIPFCFAQRYHHLY